MKFSFWVHFVTWLVAGVWGIATHGPAGWLLMLIALANGFAAADAAAQWLARREHRRAQETDDGED